MRLRPDSNQKWSTILIGVSIICYPLHTNIGTSLARLSRDMTHIAGKMVGTILPYTPSDKPALLAMYQADWRLLAYAGFNATYMFDHKAIDYRYPDNSLYIAVYHTNDGTPAGFIVYGYEYDRIASTKVGYIHILSVASDYRKQGIASQLIAYAHNEFKKRGIFISKLVTGINNTIAQKCYTKIGFIGCIDEGFFNYTKKL